jgi:hypothetical protein
MIILDSVPLSLSEQKQPGMPLLIQVRTDHRYEAQPPYLLLLVITGEYPLWYSFADDPLSPFHLSMFFSIFIL